MKQIIWPMFAMFALSVFMVFRLGLRRIAAVKAKRVSARFYRAYRGYDEPDDLAIASRHVVNLFETPLLFYIGCMLILLTQQVNATVVGLAWLYVLCRYLHSYIHLTSNIVIWRLRIFALSLVVIVALWTVLGIQLATAR